MPVVNRKILGWVFAAALAAAPLTAVAQDPDPATTAPPAITFDPAVTLPAPDNTTLVPRGEDGSVQLRLVALLTDDGQKIDRNLVWRVFQAKPPQGGKPLLISTVKQASPVLKLPAGEYLINAAFGRANLTRKITLAGENPAGAEERFVLNAGGLRVTATISGTAGANYPATFSIYSDRNQAGDRRLIMSDVKPGVVIRLNSGIYHVVSSVGDANAIVSSDVTVEAGKLTEASVTHAAAKVTFKLVTRPGGEAIAGTQWTIQTQQGEAVKQSSGAIPTHVLAPGTYTAVARSQGKSLQRSFTLKDGDTTQVEVLFQ